jgi:hypothetical protein
MDLGIRTGAVKLEVFLQISVTQISLLVNVDDDIIASVCHDRNSGGGSGGRRAAVMFGAGVALAGAGAVAAAADSWRLQRP